jgi:SAM-dependent methyltransferase
MASIAGHSEPASFVVVTEVAGDHVSLEQVERICHRYYWAGRYCAGKDVVEAACGSGQGLGYLARCARSVVAGDYCGEILARARRHYGERISLQQFDAQAMPFADRSKDVIILFEAIYYLPSPGRFIAECARVLRPGGVVLIATANKDLYDFNPSPYSHGYYGVQELTALLAEQGFSTRFFGYLPVDSVSWRQKVLRPVKKTVVRLGLMPKTMQGKQLLKRLVFGRLVEMPAEITPGMASYGDPIELPAGQPDALHKVIYCCAARS